MALLSSVVLHVASEQESGPQFGAQQLFHKSVAKLHAFCGVASS